MSKEPRSYERMPEAEQLITAICDKYKDVTWAVRPEQIAVMCITNLERGEKAIEKNPAYIKLRPVKGAEKAIFETNKIPIRNIIELYASDWAAWTTGAKQCILLNTIMEISPEEEKKNAPDLVGFKIIADALGVNWDRELATLPNILSTDIEFDLDLRPGVNTEDGETPETPEEV